MGKGKNKNKGMGKNKGKNKNKVRPHHSSAATVKPAAAEVDVIGSLKEIAGSFGTEIAALDCKPSQVQFKIDGIMYTSTKLSATVGLVLWPRLTVLLGAGLTQALATGTAGEDFDPVRMLYGVAARAMEDGLATVISPLFGRMQCGELRPSGKGGDLAPAWDEHFAGEYPHLAKVCTFAIAHNLKGPTLGVH